jgi:regulatory protein SWI5
MEERMNKANRTRRALASAASSVSAGSPPSDFYSAGNSPEALCDIEAELPKLLPEMGSFGDPISSSADPFRYCSVHPTYSQLADFN